jgi:hypothetical protein
MLTDSVDPTRVVRVKGEYVVIGGPVPERSLPAGMQWAGHDNERARHRRLRQHWARVEREALKDPAVREAREALIDACEKEAEPELAVMQYALMARGGGEELGASWAASVRVLIQKREAAMLLMLEAQQRVKAS